jgi:hypothetical protein
MNRIAVLSKIYKTLNNNVVLNDFRYRDLNWVHAIRILIFNYEYKKYTINYSGGINREEPYIFRNSNRISNIGKLYNRIKKLWISTIFKSVFRKIRGACRLLNNALKLLKFYVYANYIRIFKKADAVNFMLDNFDVKYGDFYYNPYSDNINLKQNVVNLCLPVWGKNDQTKNARFKPLIIGEIRAAYAQIFLRNMGTDYLFLNPLREILDEVAFKDLQLNIKEVYRNYLFFIFVLRQIKPKQIFLYDSFNKYSLGLIAAGKTLGIQTIEQQHGVIYPLHPGYCYNYSHEGQTDFICHQLHYYTPPLINEAKKGWSFHPELIEIPSSPAIQVWSKFKDTSEDSNLQKLKIRVSGLKVVTLGLGNELLPDWIVNSLLDLTDEYFVCFRLHPRYSNVNRNQIMELKKKIPNSDFEISSSISLFDLLETSDFFLSDGSTTILDALQFKLRCICFSDVFADSIFQPYIRQNLLLLATTSEQLIKILK